MDKLKETADFLKSKGFIEPEVGIILGTGLGKMAEEIKIEQELSYADIPHFPVSTVEYHKGRLIIGDFHGKKVIAMHGRLHYYEAYSLGEITFPVRVMKMLGVKVLIISNAAGSVNPEFRKAELMLLDDHINLLPDNPLIGKNYDELGPRYPDMSQPYCKPINDKLLQIADEEGIILHKGVYAAMSGPSLETRAEYRFLRIIGADLVGMSTVPEAIVCNHMGLPCVAISVITDECDPDHLAPVVIEEILEAASIAEDKLMILMRRLMKEL